MAGEIYLSNLSGQFDYQQILQKYEELKNQQINLLYEKEDKLQREKAAFETFGEMLKSFDDSFEKIMEPDFVYTKTATVSNEEIAGVTVTDQQKLTPLSIEFTVNRLAQNDVWLSQNGISSKEDAVVDEDGVLTLGIDGEDIDIQYSAGDSLSTIADKINQGTDKAGASIFYDGNGYRLILSSTQTGENNVISLSDSGNLLQNLGLGSEESHVQTAQDAEIEIYGESVTSHTNEFENLIEGINVTVYKTSTEPVEIKVENDLEAVKGGLEDFFSKYNSMVDYIAEVTGENGDLSGDFTLQSIRSSIFRNLTPFMEKGLIEVDHQNGHISLNGDKLDEMVKTSPDELAQTLEEIKLALEPLMESYLDPDGVINQKEKIYDKKIYAVGENILKTSQRIDMEMENLKEQFIHLDQVMAELNSLKQSISSLLPQQQEQK